MKPQKYTLTIVPVGDHLAVTIPEIGVTVQAQGTTLDDALDAGHLAIEEHVRRDYIPTVEEIELGVAELYALILALRKDIRAEHANEASIQYRQELLEKLLSLWEAHHELEDVFVLVRIDEEDEE